jgi:hypothetical protein
MIGQLDLFKGERQRGRKPPPAPEFNLHCAIADLCKRFHDPAWRYTHLPLGESRDHVVNKRGQRWSPIGTRLKRMGVVAGFPDFVFVGPNQSIFWLELKRQQRGRISEAQQDIFTHLTNCGFSLLVTDSFEEARDALVRHGILRRVVGGSS